MRRGLGVLLTRSSASLGGRTFAEAFLVIAIALGFVVFGVFALWMCANILTWTWIRGGSWTRG